MPATMHLSTRVMWANPYQREVRASRTKDQRELEASNLKSLWSLCWTTSMGRVALEKPLLQAALKMLLRVNRNLTTYRWLKSETHGVQSKSLTQQLQGWGRESTRLMFFQMTRELPKSLPTSLASYPLVKWVNSNKMTLKDWVRWYFLCLKHSEQVQQIWPEARRLICWNIRYEAC